MHADLGALAIRDGMDQAYLKLVEQRVSPYHREGFSSSRGKVRDSMNVLLFLTWPEVRPEPGLLHYSSYIQYVIRHGSRYLLLLGPLTSLGKRLRVCMTARHKR